MSVFRDLLHVEEPSGERWELALDQLRQGRTIVFRGAAISVTGRTLIVEVPTTHAPASIEARYADRLLDGAEVEVAALLEASPEFADLVQDLPLVVRLIHDYHTGSLLVCQRRDGELVWAPEAQPDERK